MRMGQLGWCRETLPYYVLSMALQKLRPARSRVIGECSSGVANGGPSLGTRPLEKSKRGLGDRLGDRLGRVVTIIRNGTERNGTVPPTKIRNAWNRTVTEQW